MNQRIIDILEKKGVKASTMRILVFELLEFQNKALSLTEVENKFLKADRITIYRTLKTFEKRGIVHSIQENNVSKYTLCSDECNAERHNDYHLHFYCHECKETTCKTEFNFSKIETFQKLEIQEVRFYANGICENCLTKLCN